MTSPQADLTTDPQSTIAALRQRLDAALAREAALADELAAQAAEMATRTAELADRKTEFDERIEHQAATADVLRVMSASPGDTQPVFDLIVRRAVELCNAQSGGLFEYDGERVHIGTIHGLYEHDGKLLHVQSLHGTEPDIAPASLAAYLRQFPMPPKHGSISMRAILDRQILHIRDMREVVDLLEDVQRLGHRSQVSLPLLRDARAIGVITIAAHEPGGFSDSQVALLKTFAEQAVIAITSAETYRALQTRTTDLQETLEYQTATSDVLKVISRTEAKLEPALETLVATAARICAADQGAIHQLHDGLHFVSASFGTNPEYRDYVARNPIAPGRGTAIGRMALERRAVHIKDVLDDPEYTGSEFQRLAGFRSVLAVPLFREDVVIGSILLTRSRVEPFTDKQIELVRTFADQAVIAIENTRLVAEQREALEQQTATAEVLQVINASPGNLAPVFDAMLEKATRLCEAGFGSLYTYDGDRFQSAAQRGVSAAYAAYRERHPPELVGAVGLDEVIRTRRAVQVTDMMAERPYLDGNPNIRAMVDLGGMRTAMVVPLCKDETALGVISVFRQEVRPFSDKQVALLENFADQAVIAIENTRLITEQREALEQQTATAEVLQVINASPGNLTPVFDAILEKAHDLCGATKGVLVIHDGEHFRSVATRGLSEEYLQLLRQPSQPRPDSPRAQLLSGADLVHHVDVAQHTHPTARAAFELEGVRTVLFVPLRRDGALLGYITAYRLEVRPFAERQISLLKNFAAQAVIAMENARLITETREALEQQTATAEVLQVLNTSPGNLAPVFDVMLQKALSLCGAAFGQLVTYDGAVFRAAAWRGYEPGPNATAPLPGMALYQLAHGEQIVHIPDITADNVYRSGNAVRRRLADEYGGRTAIWVALRKDEELLGAFVIYRTEVRPFSNKQIALLQNFAAQAVIAIENARLLNEIRQRQEELRITFENMGDGVAMFDETLRLVAWNSKFQEILDVTDEVITSRLTYADYIRYLAERGEYGPGTDPEAQLRHFQERAREHNMSERIRPDGRVIEVRHNPVAGGGFVLIYADITERKRSEAEIRAARDAAEEASRTIEAAYRDLKAAQANLIQAEKMASLGQLTAGIAHEIKNPLNFVNNFSALSTELIDELRDVLAPEPLGETARTEVDDLTALLKGNLEKVVQHGQRADGIVRSMLDHSRGSSGERRMVDLNTLIDEALNLAYHGARAQDQSFNITLERDFGEGIAPIEINPQDITRVFLNLFSNGFYAVTRRARSGADAGFEPTLNVTTRDAGEAVEIRVRDNGTGIPADIRDKLFQPFFTTKPTGEGTGLGLSITYDIVTQQHGGSIAVDSKVSDYSEFTVRLPRGILASEGGRA